MTPMRRLPIRRLLPAVWAIVATGTACNRRVLEVFFDLPASTAPVRVQPVVRAETVVVAAARRDTLPPPPIERVRNADSVIAMLPRDRAGNLDWVAALRQGIYRPRLALPGAATPDTGFRFAFDFYFPGPDTLFDATFPHSSHTELINCQQCHSRIFKYRGGTIRMGDVLAGKFCGECHGKVAFSPLTDCERCHTKLPMPPNRTQPELLGTLQMVRAAGDSTLQGTIAGNAAGVNTATLPTAQFPHWVHRIRYRCKACHTDLFEPRLGANRITMKDIGEGKACGTCHDGKTAFPAQFGYCERCHVSPAAAAGK
jgi:c(7)-type cytochrome triheme protein